MARCKTGLNAAFAAIVTAATAVPAIAANHRHHHRHAAHRPLRQAQRAGTTRGDPDSTCRAADGTPYDPDIIGGVNHVGDGGPAVNLGSGLGNPCSTLYLGGPGLLGPR